MWRVLVAETITGAVVAELTPRDLPSFSRALTDTGTWTVNVVPDDRHHAHLDLHALTDVGRFSWIVAYDETIIQAGPVVTFRYDENTRNLSVSGTGIQGLFARRVLRNPTAPVTSVKKPADLFLVDQTLRSIARGIVAANMDQPGFDLPIDLPAFETGTRQRRYQAFDFATVWERLEELAEVLDGPEIDFRPYLDATGTMLRWEMRVGSPHLGNPDSTLVWDYGGAVNTIDIDVNGSASPCMRAWALGSGSERTLLVGFYEDAELTMLEYPPTDYVDSDRSSVIRQQTLDLHAEAAVFEFRSASETWDCSVRISGPGAAVAELDSWQVGDSPLIGVRGHPWIANGEYQRRIIGLRDDTASTVALELEPTPEVI